MPTSFVSLIVMYLWGMNRLNELEGYSDELMDRILEVRNDLVEVYNTKQFSLTYYTNMTKEDVDNLLPYELDHMYNLLKKQNELEKPKE